MLDYMCKRKGKKTEARSSVFSLAEKDLYITMYEERKASEEQEKQKRRCLGVLLVVEHAARHV
jgi:hypothetical protein